MKLLHFFIPHPKTHKKAHLISTGALAIYIGLFVFIQTLFGFLGTVKPDILGVSANISVQDIIQMTNEVRVKNGLNSLKEDPRLDNAAASKAKNMFEENYWAHYSPSGKDPWGFIQSAGYKFVFAGENLARNYYTPKDVMDAWMTSPTHRDNLINPKYKDIGMAVLEGNLNGQPTLLIVQIFGAEFEPVAQKPKLEIPTAFANSVESVPTPAPNPTSSPLISSLPSPKLALTPILPGNTKPPGSKFLIDPYLFSKNFGLSLIAFIGLLMLIDLFVIKKRGVHRLASRHLSHLAILTFAATSLLTISIGSII